MEGIMFTLVPARSEVTIQDTQCRRRNHHPPVMTPVLILRTHHIVCR